MVYLHTFTLKLTKWFSHILGLTPKENKFTAKVMGSMGSFEKSFWVFFGGRLEKITPLLVVIWVFPKIWETPQIIHLNKVLHYKPILGYPYFWKHPYCSTSKILEKMNCPTFRKCEI